MKILIFVALIPLVAWGCSSINSKLGLKDDNPAEEILEELIKHYSGVDTDLSKSSPEQ